MAALPFRSEFPNQNGSSPSIASEILLDGLQSNLPQLRVDSSCLRKLDALGWTAGFAFTCYGARIGVRVTDLVLLERVLRCLPPNWKPSSSPYVDYLYSLSSARGEAERVPEESSKKSPKRAGRYNLLYINLARVGRSLELESLFELLESSLHLNVALAAPRRIFVHAGVVAWKGRALLLPGSSGSGKSSLVAELVRAGATYYSDEYAVLDERGRDNGSHKGQHHQPARGPAQQLAAR